MVLDAEAASLVRAAVGGRGHAAGGAREWAGGYAGPAVLAGDYLRAVRLRRPAAAALDRLLAQVTRCRAVRADGRWPVDTPAERAVPEFPGVRTSRAPPTSAACQGCS